MVNFRINFVKKKFMNMLCREHHINIQYVEFLFTLEMCLTSVCLK